MAAGNRKRMKLTNAALLAGVALHMLAIGMNAPAKAQDAAARIDDLQPNIPADAKLLLTANELVYNRDTEKVTVRGNVQIEYGGYKMVARQVDYDQKSGRILATGDIQLIEPGGNIVYADRMDVTDDFGNGFVQALRIETTDLTRLAAETGERRNGEEFILNKAVYTACTPCNTKPEHRSLWHIKAQRIIQNGRTRTIRLEHAYFELFGKPIAYIPVMEIPDHTVKRKSGFLFPQFRYTQKLGAGVGVPYYWAISPHMDATITGTGLTRQGFLLEGEFRQQFHNGLHTLNVAGISQLDREQFTPGTVDALETNRGMIASRGKFEINPRWSFGWNVLVQSDNNFAKTYDLSTFDGTTYVNQAYLTGLGKRNYFDLRAFYFDIQDADPDSIDENKQPVAQVLDYSYTAPEPILGGELNADFNLTNIKRNRLDRVNVLGVERFRGLEGTSHRLTGELEWKRTFIAPGGLVLTPLLAARGDALGMNVDDPVGYTGNFTSSDAETRRMLTAGLEARYPILFAGETSTHVLEPIGQLYARPDEQYAGGLPNEDAQSFVFDATNLFDRDKFSGYDRIEGGTRANIGLRYTGSFDSGYGLRAIAGQSFQLGGLNSFATDDLVKAGADSGLETDSSDYVAMLGIDAPSGLMASLSGRLDESDFSLRRADATVGYLGLNWQAALTYTRIEAQPTYGSPFDQDEIQTAAAYRFHEYWSVFGAVTYDIDAGVVSRNGLGITYDDQDTLFSIVYKQERDTDSSLANDWSIGARISFRTLGDVYVGDTRFDELDYF
ncbi:LPS-assembly protein LptD [Sinorhizobium meliloti WSM1022]|uniref:LPS-assembly protein LptD n=1 Tax=Rhizobium meliloti TaxID=382 RepID=UPI0001E4AF29|nr:LPS-assembly protein LptD [Sinorhizobium meliloti]TWB02750.1 LPS-assembly protein [Ensifer sp. SEMIA 134]TWB36562.1 LPS-assembly protein [Ensifer sp. SEMIA 135]AEG03709.1 Organic solvent tolerance protein [Sinorhizobium meliloti BL225C]AIL98974.1 Organic solvent tolerance protein [Sinorhizobium meliloti]ASJ58765.1 Organic solvent tolerance protein [Sinorhizobium meliloti]